MNKPPVITIDGPSGVGKGTTSLLLARKLGWHFLDSGVLYRLVALEALNRGISIENVPIIASIARDLDVKFKVDSESHGGKVVLSGRDVSEEVRSELCSRVASQVAAIPEVREELLERQRAFLQSPGLVTDGRDMGTVVFPDAPLKIFLEASQEERARRRCKQLQQQGVFVSFAEILNELTARDARDASRTVAPLKPAPDAVCIDTTHLSVDEVLQKTLDLAAKRGFYQPVAAH